MLNIKAWQIELTIANRIIFTEWSPSSLSTLADECTALGHKSIWKLKFTVICYIIWRISILQCISRENLSCQPGSVCSIRMYQCSSVLLIWLAQTISSSARLNVLIKEVILFRAGGWYYKTVNYVCLKCSTVKTRKCFCSRVWILYYSLI